MWHENELKHSHQIFKGRSCFLHVIPVFVQKMITSSEIVLFERHTLRRILKQKIM